VPSLLSCCNLPILAEINLAEGPVFEPFKELQAKLHFISGPYRRVQAVKLGLIVLLEVRDMNKQVIERVENEVLSTTKNKPFKRHESLKLDFVTYRELVEDAKAEFKLIQRLDYTAGLVKVENPIKTANVKRAARDRDHQ
jgi:hypothetical protein